MLIESVGRARTPDHPDGCDLTIVDGRVAEVRTPGSISAGAYDAGGRVVVPAFVDAHVHLDKAFLGVADATADLTSAIRTTAGQRAGLTVEDTRGLARRALDRLVANGTTAARAQVEIGSELQLDLLDVHHELRSDDLTLQLVAFPQNGLDQPGMPALLHAAMTAGADVVGGCPYVDNDPAAHLDTVFQVAQRYQAPVDLHLDLTDDPTQSLIQLVAERTAALGMAGLVTIGHVTTLAAMPVDEQARCLDLLARHGISLVVLPATDLYLGGHGEPGTRSLAPYDRAVMAGVRTAIANNNIGNAFAPYGNGSLLQAAWLAGLVRRDSKGSGALLDAITEAPAAILGLEPHGPQAGRLADLAVLQTDRVEDVILQAPSVVATIRRGRLLPAWSPEVVSPGVRA